MKISRIGPVQVLANLGAGAKSNVVLIRREADGKEYALKIIPVAKKSEKKYLAQARQEYRVSQLLAHPHLVRIHCLEAESDWLFRTWRVKLLAEYVPGHTLDKAPPPTVGRLLRVFERVADGVAYMHEHGIIHADLKPNNIMLGSGGVKVIDFGLARVNGESTGRLQGTPEYMAPETVTHKAVNELSDVFNFGATMYRMLTAQHPPTYLQGLPIGERTYRNRLRPASEINPRCPAGLCDLVHRCLRYQPADRPKSMGEVCRLLSLLAAAHADAP